MKYLFFCFIFAFCLVGLLEGAVFYKESIVVGDTPIGVSSTAKEPSLTSCFISVEGGDVRFWIDGTSPTSLVGHLLADGEFLNIRGINNILNLSFIRTGSVTTTLRVSYEK